MVDETARCRRTFRPEGRTDERTEQKFTGANCVLSSGVDGDRAV